MFSIVSEVAQLCQTLCDPTDCSLPGSSVHGIFQARALEWVAILRDCKILVHKCFDWYRYYTNTHTNIYGSFHLTEDLFSLIS